MIEHLLFIFYIYILLFSVLGHGFLFYKLIDKEILTSNLGYHGLIGFFSIIFISITTSFFTNHGFVHNIILHSVGLFSYFFNFSQKKNYRFRRETIYLISLSLLIIIGIYLFKTHDDFPYYHLTYTQNLSENKFIIGTGLFNHGFRTFSSLFYFNSILYLPYIELYLFHLGPFLILLFFNYIVLSEIFKKLKNNNNDLNFYFKILSFVFVNIVFYRLGEHGTDRSAQILLFLIFIIVLEISLNFSKLDLSRNLKILLVVIFLASSLKAIYFIYISLIPYVLFKIKNLKYIFQIFKSSLTIFLTIFFIYNSTINFLSTGCILYPAHKTCFDNYSWAIKKNEVKKMKIHYEWWAKAGGGPGYKYELAKEKYVENFNWLSNWIERHFFNKVSDTLFGIIFIALFSYFIFKTEKKKNFKNNKLSLLYGLILIFLLEWFLNHPAMRYGGFVLIALPIFLFTSSVLEKFKMNKKKNYKSTVFLILLTFFIYNSRNIVRLNKEINFYSYDMLSSPFYYLPIVKHEIIFQNDNIKIYHPVNNMCWNTPTPCSYNKKIKLENKYYFNVVSRKNK